MTWTRHHGKVWFSFPRGERTYEVPFDDKRWIEGYVLFFTTAKPELVKGMHHPNSFMCELEAAAKRGEPDAVAAYTTIEGYQWHQLEKEHIPATFAKGPLEPEIVEST